MDCSKTEPIDWSLVSILKVFSLNTISVLEMQRSNSHSIRLVWFNLTAKQQI